jgi:flagellar motor switch protein FliN
VADERTETAPARPALTGGEAAGPFETAAVDRRNLEVVLDISVRLSMEVGATNISIRKLLQLNRGSVVELSRIAGEPLDVLVNGTLVAHGEVVVVNDKFGIRLTDVVSPEQRLKMLH